LLLITGVIGLIVSSKASAATRITVSSTAGTLGAAAHSCTLRDALVLADQASNPALLTRAERGGRGAVRGCVREVSGHGSPYTIELSAGATYTLSEIDDYWFGPDGLPPISAVVTIQGHGARITRAGASLNGAPLALPLLTTRAFRFFYVSGGLSGIPRGSLTLRDLTLSDGLAHGGDSGGGSGAGAGMGGAVFVQGSLTLERVTMSENTAWGGSADVSSDQDAGGVGPGGGFGGSAPGARGGAGGKGHLTGGGGGGFRAVDSASGPGGGGHGGFAGGDIDGGGGGSYENGGGGDGGAFGQVGGGGANGGGGGGGGVGGGGGSAGGSGGFGGGGDGSSGVVTGSGGFGAGGGGNYLDGGGSGSAFAGGGGDGPGGGGGAGMGGAVFSLFGTVRAFDSTLSANRAIGGAGGSPQGGAPGAGLGGALFNVDGSLAVSGSTIADNSAIVASAAGGGIYSLAFGNTIASGASTTASMSLADSIVYGNTAYTADGPIEGLSDDVTLNDVKARHVNASAGHLLEPTIVGARSAHGGATQSGSASGSDPLLGPLQRNGGSLSTLQPAAGSPALGAGENCDRTDELGAPRPMSGCDLGALELTPATPVG
jgi:hypothetical protein